MKILVTRLPHPLITYLSSQSLTISISQSLKKNCFPCPDFLRLNATNRKGVRLSVVVSRVAAATVEVQDVAVVTVARVLRRRPIVAAGTTVGTATMTKSRQKQTSKK